jgi:hypothetical protein
MKITFKCLDRPTAVDYGLRKRREILAKHPIGRVINDEIGRRYYGKIISPEELYGMIENSFNIVLAPCSCREYSRMSGVQFDSRDLKELYFEMEEGGLAKLYAENTKEKFKTISRSEAKDFVKRSAEKGAIHTVPTLNICGKEKKVIDVCTCCSRQCVLIGGFLGGTTDLIKPDYEERSFNKKIQTIIKRSF